MVEVFKLNKEMVGKTYYLKPIPIMYNGKLTYEPPFSFVTAYSTSGFGPPIRKYFSYCIVDGELKLLVYGNALFKTMDIRELIPVNNPNVVELKIKMTEGFMDLSLSKIVSLDKLDLENKEKFIINIQSEYDSMVKNIDEGQLYQVVTDECHLVLSYTNDKQVVSGIKDLLSSMYIRMRELKIRKIKKSIKTKK
jgi:hypothetical protein